MKQLFCTAVVLIIAMSFSQMTAADLTLDKFDNLSEWKQSGTGKIETADDNGHKVMKLTSPGIATKIWKFSFDERSALLNYQGLSFRVKGNGVDTWDAVSVKNGSSYGWNYVCYFPIKGKDWQTVTIAWEDFVPATLLGGRKIGTEGGMPLVGIDMVTFGDRWVIGHCNAKIAPFSYLVDELKLVEKATPFKMEKFPQRQIADVVAKMKSGQPVTIVCAGDSITAGTGVDNPDVNRYGARLQAELRKLYKNDKINVKVIAVGGAQSFDLRAWANRDFSGVRPDLVTLLIGYNDKTAAVPAAFYRASVCEYLDRVSALTGGSAAFLLLTTIPGQSARFTMNDDFAATIRAIAGEQNLAIYDLAADFKAMGAKKMAEYFGDTAHPNNSGHEFIAGKLTAYFAAQK